MRDSLSFRTTLIVSFWIILLAASFVPSWYYYRSMREAVITEAENTAIRQLRLVHWILLNGKPFGDVEHLQKCLLDVAKELDVRVTYVTEGGKVIADSQFSLLDIQEMENFLSRPEIAQAKDQDLGKVIRFSRIVNTEYIYIAKKIERRGGIPSGVLRLAAPFSGVKEQLDHLRKSFFLVVSLIFVATIFLTSALTRQLRHPIRTLIEATQAIGKREYKKRVRFTPGQEFYPLAQSMNEMAENIDRHVLDITKQKQELEAVFSGMQEGVMVLDARGRIRSINKALSDLIWHSSQILGRRPLEVIISLELQEACDRVMSSQSGTDLSPDNLEVSLGEERTYDVNIVRFQGLQSGSGAIVVFHDISRLKQLEQVRRDFVANVSQELRTPLLSLKAYTETLLSERSPISETLHAFLQVIHKNTNYMVKIVEDLLQLAKLEGRQVPFRILSVNGTDALAAAWNSCIAAAQAKGIQLNSQLPAGGVIVSAEFDQLVQVFRNLLENGIQHSFPGGAVTVSSRHEDNKMVFSVRNDGPSIPKQHQKRIFERFYRIEKHRSIDSASTGLGLAICRHIVLNHRGRIWLQSPNPNQSGGCTFFFSIPAAPTDRKSDES